jgi:flagellar biosynthetic protein FliR
MKELAFGFLLGFISSLVFAGIQAAGHLIGLQSGFGLANVLDPLSGEQGSIIDQFYLIIAVLLFLSVNGHHQFLLALERSFSTVPIDGYTQPFAANAEELVAFVARTTGTVFEVGLRLAVAVGGALLITDVVMGLTARAIPQMNVFMVGAPLKLMVAMVGIVLALPTTAIAMVFAFERVLTALNTVLQAF